MPIDFDQARQFLREFKFTRLFVECLGWDHYPVEPLTVKVDGREYRLKPVAEKADFAIFECAFGGDDATPQYPLRRKIESRLTKQFHEHIIIFTYPATKSQIWQWVKRESGKHPVCREHHYDKGQSGEHLLQRLRQLSFSLDEEPSINITEVTLRVRFALDVEKVTKRFYERFRTELNAFREFIHGIANSVKHDWYASLMLNRMMFIYFIQKQGFLDDDSDYLRNRLNSVRQQAGSGRFQQFYRIFLLRLFHEGLGQPEAERTPALVNLIGKVPFLNGGLFDVHDLERDNPDINIPDEAFERLFNFFDEYRWHLDERPHRADNEINPDVLGYIFEKYINQKQMGAYYTKEDVTGYISRNTVIPFLFDAAKKKCPVAFIPGGGVWQLLRNDPDRYIYPAVGHGITWNARDSEAPELLDTPLELPGNIEAGISDVSKRGDWNRPADEEYALPTETWREVVARRQRYKEIRAKLSSGEITEINDLITLNLDIEQFANDVITQSEGPELLRAFWHAMRDISVLDPTCGSGAFLFAALNILEPLYTACLEGMRGFMADLERSERRRRGGGRALNDFRTILEQVDKHPSERYFTLKSIVLNNLYGVDIMEEAVEICKLRLFLKLVAQLESYDQIEPLPDIDFNIRAGNALVGFTSLDAVRQAMTITPKAGNTGQYRALSEEQQEILERILERTDIASRAFDRFREQQTKLGGKVTTSDKANLLLRLKELDDELNYYLATEYGVNTQDANTYLDWRTGHKPFHWFVEFYGVIKKGGFDVVLGNPPYVEYFKVKDDYTIKGYQTESCGNLYSFVFEIASMVGSGRIGVIIPISFVSTRRMEPVRNLALSSYGDVHISNYADRPSSLFPGVHQKLSIVLGSKSGHSVHTTGYRRAYSKSGERDYLFATTTYHLAKHNRRGVIRKYRTTIEDSVRAKINRIQPSLDTYYATVPHGGLPFQLNRRLYTWVKCFLSATHYSSGFKTYYPVAHTSSSELSAIFNSSHFFWNWETRGDCWDLIKEDIADFNVNLTAMHSTQRQALKKLGEQLEADLEANKRYVGSVQTDYEYYHRISKPIIDEIDRVLAQHYGLTDEELDFIINYNIKYRMGSGT